MTCLPSQHLRALETRWGVRRGADTLRTATRAAGRGLIDTPLHPVGGRRWPGLRLPLGTLCQPR